ncbi:MAG: flagellar motor protein MotD [Sulfuricella sp.]|nr:flagellar motor protein MotD [Sulfuricella sp.]
MARKHKHEEHENLERWLVSYADFITLLFAFFVVMYSISQVNTAKYKVLSSSLVSAFKNSPSVNAQVAPTMRVDATSKSAGQTKTAPATAAQVIELKQIMEMRRRQQQAEKLKAVAKSMLKAMAALIKEGLVSVTHSERGVAIEINASALFASGQAVLEPGAVKTLYAVGQELARIPNMIQVEGFTDNTPINTPVFPSNWELSTARASSVVRLLAENGAAPERFVAVGYGEFRPSDTNSTPEGRSRNRHVTITILAEQEADTNAPAAGQTPKTATETPKAATAETPAIKKP